MTYRTIQVKLYGDISPIIRTIGLYNRACQMVLDYGYQNKMCRKFDLHYKLYYKIREALPDLPSGFVYGARDQAAEMLKREKMKRRSVKKSLQMRYNSTMFKFFPESKYVSISSVDGRLKYEVKLYDYIMRYIKKDSKFTNAQVLVKLTNEGLQAFMNIQVKIDEKEPKIRLKDKVLGIDRGIKNIVTCSDNTFINSKYLRSVKGRYQFLKSRLQQRGTRSSRFKLRDLSGRERRFVLQTNHKISKEIVNKPFGIFALEKLSIMKNRKKKSRLLNKMIGGWSYAELLTFIKYKAASLGKTVIQINPSYTSQTCSKCKKVSKESRNKLEFKCVYCGFELNADLNAARNIGNLGRSEVIRLVGQQPIVTLKDGSDLNEAVASSIIVHDLKNKRRKMEVN